jgi:MFS family permease
MRPSLLLIDRRPLQIPAFRRLWTSSAISAIGGSFSLIAVPTQLFTLTGSSATVGLASAVSLVVLVSSALWFGALADAVDRRRLLVGGNLGLALAYLGLWLQAALDLRSVAVLLILVAAQGLGFAATLTTFGAAVPRVVPAELLVAANSLSALTRYAGAVIGPLLAGALIPSAGLGPLYLCDAVALTGVVWAAARLPPLPPSGSGRVSVRSGLHHVRRHSLLLAVLAVDLAAMVFSLPFALYPELAERVYGGPPGGGTQLGLLYAAYPAGVFLAALASGTFTRTTRHGALMAGAALMWGACVVLLGLAGHLWLGLVALVAGGAVNFVLSSCRNAISQTTVDDGLRGRIQGVLTVVLIGGPQCGNLLHGFGGSTLGARPTIAIGGVLTIVAVLFTLRVLPDLWRYRVSPVATVGAQRPAERIPPVAAEARPRGPHRGW